LIFVIKPWIFIINLFHFYFKSFHDCMSLDQNDNWCLFASRSSVDALKFLLPITEFLDTELALLLSWPQKIQVVILTQRIGLMSGTYGSSIKSDNFTKLNPEERIRSLSPSQITLESRMLLWPEHSCIKKKVQSMSCFYQNKPLDATVT